MRIKHISAKIFSSVLFTLLIISFKPYLYAAQLNDFYQPLLKKGSILYEGKIYHFMLEESGVHGNTAYDNFDATPYFCSFENVFKFSPLDYLELSLGLNQVFPTKYKRSTYNTSGNLAVLQNFGIDYFYDYTLGLRIRKEPVELYLDILEKRQKDNWTAAIYPANPYYFSYILAHYEDIKTGIRYLSKDPDEREISNLSKLRRPLLSDNQINIEGELEYRNGKLRRNTYNYTGGLYFHNFYQTLKPHLTPGITLRYGLNNNSEMESGLFFTTPFKYLYDYREYRPDGTTLLIAGDYELSNNLHLPLSLRYRPEEHLEIMFSSDFYYVNQKLEYWKKATDNTVTNYPTKKLTYYNTQPTLTLTYLYDNNKKIEQDEFSKLTKDLLLKKQFLIEIQYEKDVTHLNKNSANGPLNLIDPYNTFLYPLDYFVISTEYSAFLTGNTSRFVTNINPQNYYRGQFAFTYGITDNFNAGFKIGYHSSSSLHHFTLYDIASRFYKFKPYYFFDVNLDWRATKNSLLSFSSHFVPEYRTSLNIDGTTPQEYEYKAKNYYLAVSLQIKILF